MTSEARASARRAVPARRLRTIAAAAPLLALLACLAGVTWRRWPDLLIDFGQQLYIPWRLAAGERLGTDVLYFHGPLSQHLNALLFRVFGVSFSTLIGANLLLVVLLTWILARLVRRASDRLTGWVAAAAFLCLFAFAQYVMVGNYNFLAPYTHEATHGLLFGAGMVLLIGRFLRRGCRRSAAAAGLLLGLALLTKVEAAVAALAVAAAAVFVAALRAEDRGRRLRGLLPCAAAAVVPSLLFFLWFLTYLPPGEAARATAAGFLALGGGVTRFAFHRHVLGIDDLPGNFLGLTRSAATFGFGVLMLVVTDRLLAPRARRPVLWGAAAGLAFLFVVTAAGASIWVELPRALPLVAAVAIAASAWRLLRSGSVPRAERGRREALLLLAVWALAATLKGILNLHLYHYGFTLALPATMLALVLLLHEGPARMAARGGGSGVVFRFAALGVVAAALLFHVRWTMELAGLRTFPVGRGGDRIVAFAPEVAPGGPIAARAIDWIERTTPEGATLVTLPEGIMLNYQTRRLSTVPFTNFVTAEAVLFGQDRLVAALDRRPPDFVAIVARKTEELGTGRFGFVPGYGKRVVDWVEAHYETAAQFGADPLVADDGGIRILKRRALASQGASR